MYTIRKGVPVGISINERPALKRALIVYTKHTLIGNYIFDSGTASK